MPIIGEEGLSLAGPAPVFAQEASDPRGDDPLRLVPFANTSHRLYSLSEDLWEVWVCRVPGWDTVVDLGEVVDFLNTTVSGYFRDLSDGRYRPTFRQKARTRWSAVPGWKRAPSLPDAPKR